MMTGPDFQSYAGPGDRNLMNNEITGYQPVSRIGEVVMNAFVDAYEFSNIADTITAAEMHAIPKMTGKGESRPFFHEWATVQPGMITVARKKKAAIFRQYMACETAVPVIACVACLPKHDEQNYFFSGVARSKSVRSPDDGIGPQMDEFFTVSIGGMATILNTSGFPIYPGDQIEWCFANAGTGKASRPKQGPRRVAIQVASVSSPRIIGR